MRRGRLAYMLLFIGVLLTAPLPAPAAELRVATDTIFRGFERDVSNGTTLKAAPAYEYLQLDYGDLKTPGLSLHANAWGRVNLGDDYNSGTTAGELLYGYMQYVPPSKDFQLRVGRQYIFEGVARDSVDGIYGKTFLIPSVTLSGYAGYPSALDTTNGRRGDLIYGGRLTHSLPGRYDVGVSYKFIANNGTSDEKTLGTDITFLFPADTSLFGHSTFDPDTREWKEHYYELRFPLGPFTFQPFFQHFRYADYFNNNSNSANPFRYLQGTDNTLTVAGTEAFYYPSDHLEFALRVKNYDYDKRFGPSQFYTLLAIWKWKIHSEVGAEFGRMQGSEAENRYYLSRGYFFWNIAPMFVTGDLMYVNYDEAIYGKNSSLFASLGGGSKFLNDALSVKLSFDYSKDPYFNQDFRSMLKISYLLDKTWAADPKKK